MKTCCKTVLVLCLTFLKASGKCHLEKIFRTPKDMSRVNFDHLELVERAGFEGPETTTTEQPLKPSKEGGFAHAHVSIRFGGDDVRGSHNHIMKIPPQARHGCPNELFYPPPQHRYDHPHYYHPYPPPVPFDFPNYYFCNYGPGKHSLPPQLREYFGRHPEFFDGPKPRREQVFIWGRPLKKEDLEDLVVPVVNATNVEESLVNKRLVKEVKLSNEKIEEDVNQIVKTLQKKGKTTTNEVTERKIHVTHRHKKGGKKNTKSTYDQDLSELEHLLEKALKTFKCEECSEESSESNLVTDRKTLKDFDNSITEETCHKEENSTKSEKKKFSNDLDDLVTVIIGVVDQPEVVPNSPPHLPKDLLYPTWPIEEKPSKHTTPSGDAKKLPWLPSKWIMVPFQASSSKSEEFNGFCPKCGRRHSRGNFCPHCGSSVHASFCPLCKKLG